MCVLVASSWFLADYPFSVLLRVCQLLTSGSTIAAAEPVMCVLVASSWF
jgi:hypothetical protein